MNIKLSNLVLLGAAFAAAGIAAEISTGSTSIAKWVPIVPAIGLALFAAAGSFLWSKGALQAEQSEWAPLAELLNGKFEGWHGGIHGTVHGTPIHIRIETDKTNAGYIHDSLAQYCSAKYYFALTLSVPFREEACWRLMFHPQGNNPSKGAWRTICPSFTYLAHKLDQAGVPDLFAEWSKFTVLKCDGEKGELTLRYPAAHMYYCPTVEELENEINLVRHIAATWQCATHSEAAA